MPSGRSVTEVHLERIKRIAPWLVAVGFFMENLDSTILNTVVPVISEDLNVSALSLKAVVTTYTLSLAVFIPISGWMADRFGTRKVFRTAVALFTLGSLLCGLSVNLNMLVASRVLQGIGGAMMTPVGRLVLVRTFPREDLLRVMNFVVIPALIAPMVGPFLGGLIVEWLPWRTIFFVNLPIGIVGWWMVGRYMPDHRDPDVPPMDKWGFLLFGAGVALLSYVLEVFGEHNWSPAPMLAMSIASVVLLIAYGIHAHWVKFPLLSIRLFMVRTFRISVIGGFITRLGVSGMPFLLPLLYQLGMGYSPLQAGLFTTPQALGSIGMKVLSTRLIARLGFRTVLRLNTVLLGCNIMAFSLIGPGVAIWAILLLSLTQGLFSSLQFTCMNTLVYADINDEDASKANSIASTFQQMARGFGVAVASLVAAIFLGGHVEQQDAALYANGLHHAFIALGIATIISSLTFSGLRRNDGVNVSGNVVEVRPKSV
ncbi:MAG: DHA2 family efflux MFS transporter permease subunit [Flavobacteriales bacterium]|nr:DHA2 family efflux MFS transporter permease subunit [Flavobacteriales bacterium]